MSEKTIFSEQQEFYIHLMEYLTVFPVKLGDAQIT